MKTLVSMVCFILTDKYTAIGHKNYAKFLSLIVEIWMFVPCKLINDVWVVLKEPKEKDFWESMPRKNGKRAWNTHRNLFEISLNEYQQAKEKCLFTGFEVCNRQKELVCLVYNEEHFLIKHLLNKTVEALVKYNLELSSTSIKQILK